MNKIIKVGIMSGICLIAFELGGKFGQGLTLGDLARNNLSANEAIEVLSCNKKPTARFIVDVAKYAQKKES